MKKKEVKHPKDMTTDEAIVTCIPSESIEAFKEACRRNL